MSIRGVPRPSLTACPRPGRWGGWGAGAPSGGGLGAGHGETEPNAGSGGVQASGGAGGDPAAGEGGVRADPGVRGPSRRSRIAPSPPLALPGRDAAPGTRRRRRAVQTSRRAALLVTSLPPALPRAPIGARDRSAPPDSATRWCRGGRGLISINLHGPAPGHPAPWHFRGSLGYRPSVVPVAPGHPHGSSYSQNDLSLIPV